MPARIVLVHEDPAFVEDTVKALRAAGDKVAAFTDTMSALDALEAARRVEVLITRVRFAGGMPNGVALSRMARVKRPGVEVLFVALAETRIHTEGLGEFLPAPASTDDVVRAVDRLVAQRPTSQI